MKIVKRIMTGILLVSIAVTLFSFVVPKDWFKAGSKPKSYEMDIDKGAGQDGKDALSIKSIDKNIDGFGTLMQNSLPDKFLGKRIRMSGLVKTKDVSKWSGLWLRIDQKGSTEPLVFDNMHDGKKERSIKGTTEWRRYEIVLDVPLNASQLAYGALLVGTGQIWFDNLNFEVVDDKVPVTGSGKAKIMPNKGPFDLYFKQ